MNKKLWSPVGSFWAKAILSPGSSPQASCLKPSMLRSSIKGISCICISTICWDKECLTEVDPFATKRISWRQLLILVFHGFLFCLYSCHVSCFWQTAPEAASGAACFLSSGFQRLSDMLNIMTIGNWSAVFFRVEKLPTPKAMPTETSSQCRCVRKSLHKQCIHSACLNENWNQLKTSYIQPWKKIYTTN